MSGTGNFTLSWNLSGGPDGARTGGPSTITITNAVNETLPVALSIGANTISVPSATTVALIIPPNYTTPGVTAPNPAFGGVLTLKGVAGDSGLGALSLTGITMLPFVSGSAPSSFVINSTATGNVTVLFA